MKAARRRGSILILSLWTASFLSILAASLGSQAGSQHRLAEAERRSFEGHWALVSGLNLAVKAVAEDPEPYCDAAGDTWRGNLRLGPSWRGRVAVTVDDEDAKLNLNLASKELLEELLERLGLGDARGLAKKLVRYRESKKNRRFDFLEELSFAEGMTERAFEAIAPYGTVATDENVFPAVNVNTATPLVLEAIVYSLAGDEFAKQELSRKLAGARALPFAPDELAPEIFMAKLSLAPSPQMTGLVSQLSVYLKTDSTAFRARVEAPAFAKSARAIFKCRTESCQAEIAEWRED